MKQLFSVLILLTLTSFILCSDKKETKKHSGPWLTNFKTSLSVSKKEEKPIFVLFTGKAWCPPCKELESTILSKKMFLDYAKKNIVLVELDFPQNENANPENNAISQEYGIKGFPTMLLIDHGGNPIQKFGFSNQSEKDFLEELKSSVNKTKSLALFLKEKDLVKKDTIAKEFMKHKLEGTNVVYYSKILFTGIKNSTEINNKDKIIQLSNIYIYASDQEFIDKITTFLKEIDPKGKLGSNKIIHLKEFLKINRSHNDEKAYEFIMNHKESFSGENAGHIHKFAMHIAHHGKYKKAIAILELVAADPILKKYPDISKRLKLTIKNFKEKLNPSENKENK